MSLTYPVKSFLCNLFRFLPLKNFTSLLRHQNNMVPILSHIMGKLNISMMMMTGKPVTADEAKQMGLVNIVVPKEELIVTAEKLAKSTMNVAPSSIGVMKKLLYQRFRHEDLEQSAEELIKILQTDEGKEGHKAFTEKRQPNWVISG